MQSIVADTTPLNYLVLIQAADILPELYRTVLIPPAVKAEQIFGHKTRPYLNFRITEIYAYKKLFLYIALPNMRK